MIDAFTLTGVAKWNFDTAEYEPYELPENCPLTLPYSDESMETEINCANCHKIVKFGRCYTSKTIHTQHGFGYPVCESCYNKEFEQYMKARNKMMKRYKLLKDLPFAKAGEIFKEMLDDDEKVLAPEKWVNFRHEIFVEELDNLNEWFEEIKSFIVPDEFEMGFWTIMYGEDGFYTWHLPSDKFEENYEKMLKYHMEIGLAFKTKKEAEKHLEWLKARAILLGDVKSKDDDRFEVRFDRLRRNLYWVKSDWGISSEIRFSNKGDAEASIDKHEKEWKIYLGVE